jgi:hypothetical protein
MKMIFREACKENIPAMSELRLSLRENVALRIGYSKTAQNPSVYRRR